MKFQRIILAGVTTAIAAWLSLGQAALVYAAPATTTAPTTTSTTSSLPGNSSNAPEDIIQPTCDVSYVGWLVCPLINVGVETIQKLSALVIDMLQIRPLVHNNSLYDAWAALRNLADVFFILVFMILIFGTTLSINMPAYQLKSLLPKLIAAAILVQFSFFLSSIAIDVGNVLGSGVGSIFAQLGSSAGSPSISSGVASGQDITTIAVTAMVAIIAGFIVTWPVILLMLVGMLLSVLGVFLTLAARQLIIAVLVVTSPLAFVAWVLPGTQNYFKLWLKNLTRVILLYPMIVVLLSVGGLLARAAVGSSDNGPIQAVNQIIASIIPIVVFFSIPATFKWAGGIMDWAQSKYLMSPMSNAGKRVRGSQLMKDMKERAAERGFTNARDIATLPGDSKAVAALKKYRRGIGRAQSGQFGWGVPTRRRLARGYDAALKTQMDDWGAIFDDQQMGNADLMNQLVYNFGTQSTPEFFEYTDAANRNHRYRITKAMRAQAIGQIAKQGGNLELARIYNRIFDMQASRDPNRQDHTGQFIDGALGGMPVKEVTDMWFRGIGSSGQMSTIIGAIPSINPGKLHSVYDTLSASQVAGMHGSAAGFFLDRVVADVEPSTLEQQLGKGIDDLREERASRVLNSFAQIAQSRDLTGRVDQQTMKRFKDAVTPGAQDIDPVTGQIIATYDQTFHDLMQNTLVHYDGANITGQDFFDNHVTPEGKIIR